MARNDDLVMDCSVPGTILGQAPCTQCYSVSELKRLLMLALGWFEYYDMPEDLDTLIDDSKCWVCTSKKQKLEALVIVLGSLIFQVEPEDADLKEMLACVRCVDDAHVDAALIFLICSFFDWGDVL